ncbi:MAG TPA: hypothetical protein VNA04_12040 [Thermoanaerobaculia bacterium]|nr:hypothetical protein [Thermoanaerobaculia bacterium]
MRPTRTTATTPALIAIAFLRRGRGAAPYLVVFSVTVSLATFDWIMALEPHWASTILAAPSFPASPSPC